MKSVAAWLIACIALAVAGCASKPYSYSEPAYALKAEKLTVLGSLATDPALEEKILALDPERITESDIRNVLAAGPTPRIVNLHGGIYPVHLLMESFSRFLIRMGYPEAKIRDPRDGQFSHSPYESSERLAGMIAWYYEKEGMRPMLVGHSQGGIQVVKVLNELAGKFADKVRVWNPLTDEAEDRVTIIDPLTGAERPVVRLTVSYATAVGAGGTTLLLPNQWIMAGRVRTIPDSVEEFTGFAISGDLVALDLPNMSPDNQYHGNGTAKVRHVTLPVTYSHVAVPATAHLAKDAPMRDWINAYAPDKVGQLAPLPEGDSDNILWAADVWYSIKKHWCLEAQRLIQARRAALAAK